MILSPQTLMEKESDTPAPPSYNATAPASQEQNPPALMEKQGPATPIYHMTATPPAQNPYIQSAATPPAQNPYFQPVGAPQSALTSGQLSGSPVYNQFTPQVQSPSNPLGAGSPPRISAGGTMNYQTPAMTTPSFQTPTMQQPQMAQMSQPQFGGSQQLGAVPQQFGAIPQQSTGVQPQYTSIQQQQPPFQQQHSGFQQQQPGFQQQQHPGIQPHQTGIPPLGNAPTQQYYSATPLRLLGQGSTPVDCPVCRQRQMTQITMEAGNTTHAWAIGFCVVFCLGFIPYLMTSLKDVTHNCGSCGALLATWHRSGRVVVHAHS